MKRLATRCAWMWMWVWILWPILPAVAQEPNRLTAEEQAEGWLLLFDGETFFGWRPAEGADWRIEDGAIVVSQGEQNLLTTTTQFADFVLKLEFRAPAETNSGIFLRTPPVPRDPAVDCYELNIAPPDNPFPTGSFVKRQKVESLDVAADQWHQYEVTADGGSFTVKLDGQVVLEYQDPHPLGRGFIGLQHNQGHVAFRNIKLKPINLKSIFNEQDLTGWKTYPQMESEFSVTDEGVLHVQGGPGQLETEQAYGDFVLQLEVMTHAKNLNSGIFFRSIPGEKMNGYESQIHNGWEGDRSQPLDAGTGAIFRRTQARRVVANDQEWFLKTIIAEGPHFSVWVNGYQVTDWTDQRKPDPNPRRGRRLEAGTIIIQGHDPTTDLSFRNIRIREMPPRWPQPE